MTVRFVQSGSVEIPDCFLADRGATAPVLVAIHGISRNAAEIASRFADDPRFDAFTICAPLFERDKFGQYQQMTAARGRHRSDAGLLLLLDSLSQKLGSQTDRVSLFGFSGGAQMAHRFAMIYPARVTRVVAVAAGWYLMPDPDLDYPYGLGQLAQPEALISGFLSVPITVAVGTRDLKVDSSVRQNDAINSVQGRSRKARAKKWVNEMQKCAERHSVQSKISIKDLESGSHDFGQCVREAGLMDVVAQAMSRSGEIKHEA